MRLVITIDTDNAAFGTLPWEVADEVTRILETNGFREDLMRLAVRDTAGINLRDVNGNVCGSMVATWGESDASQ